MSSFDIKKIADLANLIIDDSEAKILEEQFKDILAMVDELSEVEFTGETLPFEIDPSISNSALRKDQVLKDFGPGLIAKNAPQTTGDFLSVPQIIEKEES